MNVGTSNNKKKKKICIKKTSYTTEEKLEVLRVFKENGYNYAMTAKETGVSVSSIRSWAQVYAKDLANNSAVDIIAGEIEFDVARIKKQFVNRHFDKLNKLAEASISRALEIVQYEEDLNKINNTIKIISDFVVKLGQAAGQTEEAAQSSVNVIQQNIMMLNQIKARDE